MNNFESLVEIINPFTVCSFLQKNGWKKTGEKYRGELSIYETGQSGEKAEVEVPVCKSAEGYLYMMEKALTTIAEVSSQKLEQIVKYFVNAEYRKYGIHQMLPL